MTASVTSAVFARITTADIGPDDREKVPHAVRAAALRRDLFFYNNLLSFFQSHFHFNFLAGAQEGEFNLFADLVFLNFIGQFFIFGQFVIVDVGDDVVFF